MESPTESGKNEHPPSALDEGQGEGQGAPLTDGGPVATDPTPPLPPQEKKSSRTRTPAFVNKIWLLLWKNYLLRRRHYILTGVELLLPLIITFFLNFVMNISSPKPRTTVGFVYEEPKNDKIGLNISTVPSEALGCWVGDWDSSPGDRKSGGRCKVFYTPRDVGQISNLKLPSDVDVDWVGAASESLVEKEALKLNLKQLLEGNPGAVVIFGKDTRTVLAQKKGTLHYGIRFLLTSGKSLPVGRTAKEYKNNPHLPTVQRHLDEALLDGIAGTKAEEWKTVYSNFEPESSGKRGENEDSDPDSSTSSLIVNYVGIGFVVIVISIMKSVVSERVSGIKELMKLSGLPNWMHWTAWTLNFLLVPIITITILTLMFTTLEKDGGRILWLVSPPLLWIVFWLWIFAAITLCFLISSIFPKPMVAIGVGMLLFVITSIAPGKILENSYNDIGTGSKMGICLFPNAGLFFALRIMFKWERGGGAGFGNLFKEFDNQDTLTLGLVSVMLIVDILLYFFLTLYLEAVLPTEFGVRRPVYFLFTPSFWGCEKKETTSSTGNAEVGHDSGQDDSAMDKAGFETEPKGLPVGVEIKKLRKVFGRNVAVDGVSFKMFQGEIFALLGHNGAGKTTAISCCVGMMAPTSGTAIINGFDIVKEMDLVREQIGICPQHNLLFDELTVDQHLQFFGKLKGISPVEATKERNEMLQKLQLTSSQQTLAKNLSGGQKRKLCLGISLIGNAKVVFLDEPTSGMDGEARRAIWDLLLAERGNRTIILTTHFMEEADVLGDRIGIMAHGKVQCCGTSLFLKRFYGTGYTLSMTLSDSNRDNRNNILSEVRVLVPSATFKEQAKGVFLSSDQLEINLPTEACSTSTFSQMFKSLEGKKQSFGIKSFGLSLTTMDEVFVKVDEAYSSGSKNGKLQLVPVPSVIPAKTEENEEDQPKTESGKSNDKEKNGKTPDPDSAGAEIGAGEAESEASTVPKTEVADVEMKEKGATLNNSRAVGCGLILLQFKSFLIKRFHYTQRKWKLFLAQVLLPVLLVVLAVLLANDSLPTKRVKGSPNKIAISAYPKDMVTYYRDTGNAKQLQLMTGVSPGIYWSASFIWDFLVMVVVSLILVIVFILCEQKNDNWTEFAFTNNAEGIFVLFLILVVFAYAAVPFSHVFSLIAGSVVGGFAMVALIHFMIANSFTTLAFAFEGSPSIGYYIVAIGLRALFSIFPSFGFTLCLMKWVVAGLQRSKCMFLPPNKEALLCVPRKADLGWAIPKGQGIQYDKCCKHCTGVGCVANQHYLTWWMVGYNGEVAGLGIEIISLFLVGTLYHVILILWEVVLGPMWKFRVAKDSRAHVPNEDQDVEDEAQRVMEMVKEKRVDEDALVVEGFSKDYGTFAAVKDVNFGVHHGECFGLLGVNGAGKTTTFRMLTGDESRTSGNAYASGCDLKNSRKKFLGKIGYCPQFDGIIGVLTGLEMVQLFGRLRGVRNVKKESKEWMAKVGLTESENVQCRKYSGGMKRRLTAAIALIGDPDILLLDEPTTGVDPVSRREFWKIILSAKADGRAVILTSHSMDEIAACCTRLAIMVNGQLQSLGGIQYLKNKFAIGFSLDVKLKSVPEGGQEYASLGREIIEKMAPCDLKDSHATAWQYQLYDATAPWDVLFSKMEEIKAKYPNLIEDYAISETTLEQVFLSFARKQYSSRETGGGPVGAGGRFSCFKRKKN